MTASITDCYLLIGNLKILLVYTYLSVNMLPDLDPVNGNA